MIRRRMQWAGRSHGLEQAMGDSDVDSTVNRERRPIPSVRHAREDRAARWCGLLVSVLLHALVFLLWGGKAPDREGEAPGARRPVLTAGGGGLRAVRVSLPQRRDIPPPPRPVLAVEVPKVEIRELEISIPGAELLPVGAPGRFPGLGGGPGQGDGGEGGAGDGYISPIPRSVVPHWNPPRSVRGMEITARVFVDANGHPSLVELDPPTPDAAFNREIIRQLRRWEYRPAELHGAAVEGWAEITFIF